MRWTSAPTAEGLLAPLMVAFLVAGHGAVVDLGGSLGENDAVPCSHALGLAALVPRPV